MKRKGETKRSLVLFACAFALLFYVGSCKKADAPVPAQESQIAAAPVAKSLLGLIKEGKLIVGTSADYPPYEFRLRKDESSQIVGLDIAIAEAIAKELDLELEVRDIFFSKLIAAVENNEVDMIIAGLSPTEERKGKLDFSDVYYQALQNMVVRAADKERFANLDNLRDKKIGTQQGSIQADMVKRIVRGGQFVEMVTTKDLINALKNKEVDAIMMESPVADALVYKDADLAVVDLGSAEKTPGMEMMDSAIAVRKGNNALLMKVNEILQRLIADNKIASFAADAKTLMDLP